ncbi:MAG: ExbD/TolR family protein [Alistipes sp.]
MADIAFLLLIFFLVATTMNVDTGLVRVLPPCPAPTSNRRISR